MKRVLYSVLTTFVVIVAVACGKSNSDSNSNNGGTNATTPQACNIPGTNNTTCNPAGYPADWQPYQYSYTNGFCGCPNGTRPVMNMSYGISCAPSNFFPSYYSGGSYGGGYYNPQNGQWTSIPQITYSPATYGSTTNCYSQATSTCDTRLTTANGTNPQCASGGYCRQTAGGSYMGLCTYGAGNESYQPACSYYYDYYGTLRYRCGTSYYGSTYGNYYGGGYYGGGYYNTGGGLLPR